MSLYKKERRLEQVTGKAERCLGYIDNAVKNIVGSHGSLSQDISSAVVVIPNENNAARYFRALVLSGRFEEAGRFGRGYNLIRLVSQQEPTDFDRKAREVRI